MITPVVRSPERLERYRRNIGAQGPGRRGGVRPALRTVAVVIVLIAFVLISPVGPAEAAAGPVDLSGEISGAPFRISVPAAWNGTLLVYAHGYRDKADHPGEVDDRSAPLAPVPVIADGLLQRGYALAGTAYQDNGWAVEQALTDVRALTEHFRDVVARPTRTILWGTSMGTVVTLETAERTAGLFDGYLVGCTVGAGAPQGVADATVALRLAYDVTFGMPTSWGTAGDVRDDLDFETEVQPRLAQQASDPAAFGRFEFVRLVLGLPGAGVTAPTGYFPKALLGSFYYATEATAELERRAGGPVGQNITHFYTLSQPDKDYLRGLGVDPERLLAAMNRRDITAQPEPRNYVERFADYTGAVKGPILALHTTVDPITPVAHESAYRDTIDEAGRGGLLVQTYTNGVGHCQFTPEQAAAAITAIDTWTRTGTPPGPAAFPADLGFVSGFRPPPWPQG
jgi:pimeloyl-ACP methyl ester carboxylesterase